jgi:hypothetical protein
MKIRFYWREYFGELAPACETDAVNKDGVSLLSCLLMDNGGTPYLQDLPGLEQGLDFIQAVKRGEANEIDWGREVWAALIRKHWVKIYSEFQEGYATEMNVDAFEQVLRAWIEFIQTPPDSNTSVTLEV